MLDTHDEILAYVRERYGRALDESMRLMSRLNAGEIDVDTYLREDTRIMGMREAYAGMIGALGEIL